MRICTRFMWPKVMFIGRLLWTWYWIFGLCKRWGSLWWAEWLLLKKDCSMSLHLTHNFLNTFYTCVLVHCALQRTFNFITMYFVILSGTHIFTVLYEVTNVFFFFHDIIYSNWLHSLQQSKNEHLVLCLGIFLYFSKICIWLGWTG